MRRFFAVLAFAAAILAGSALSALAAERLSLREGGRKVAVTVTNVTRGQIFSPPIVVAHDASLRLFQVGEPASPELAGVAEDANGGPLVALLGTLPEVYDVNVGDGVILPGESRTVEVTVSGRFPVISVVGM